MRQPLDDGDASPARVTRSLVEAAEFLGLVRAEVGRLLGFRCEQFTALYEGRGVLEEGTHAWRQAVLFVRLYRLLHARFAGERAHMVNWLRRHHAGLGNSPFYLLIDEGRLAEVVDYIEGQAGE